MAAEPEMPETDRDRTPGEAPLARDSLTIRRLLLLTAGLAIGLGLFTPERQEGRLVRLNLDATLGLFSAAMLGLALPAPLFVLGQRLAKGPAIGPGGLYALTMGLGALLMLPPVVMHRFAGKPGAAIVCLFYVMPLVSLWYFLAAAMTGHLGRKLFARATAWTERYGFLLAVLWTPLGVWLLIQFYMDSF